MPNIGRPFNEAGVARYCYICSGRVLDRSYNWTYDPRNSSPGNPRYRHTDCQSNHMWDYADYALHKQRQRQNPTPTIPPPPPPPPPPIIPQPQPQPISTHFLDTALTSVRLRHFQASEVIDEWKLGHYPFMYGSPGSGKTTLMQHFAEDLFPSGSTSGYLPFLLITCDKELSRTTLLGSESPLNGKYYGTKFRKIWENGGIVLFDEVGNCTGSFVNMLNSMLEQKYIDWPDGTSSTKHEHCYPAFACNSALWGTDSRYPERENLGSAFRNRLAYIEYQYDETLETAICRGILSDIRLCDSWVALVRRARLICNDPTSPLEVSASPRVAYAGARKLQFALTNNRQINRAYIIRILKSHLFEGLSNDVIGQAVSKIESSREYLAFQE